MSSAVVSGDVTVLGTASINVLQINTTINSTGSNTLGDNANDTQTLYGTVRIPTGSLTVTGSASVTGTFTHGSASLGAGLITTFDGNYINLVRQGVTTFIGAGSAGNSFIGTNSNQPFSFLTNGIGRAQITAGGNVLIGTTTDSGYMLDVNGTARTGYLSTDRIQNASNSTWIEVIGSTGIGSNDASIYLGSRNGNTYTNTSGFRQGANMIYSFAPTSGTAIFTGFQVTPTINQTGGANGVTRGLYINPTLTSAADFRAIETTSGSISFNHGATPLMFISSSGNVGIGTTSSITPLDVNRVGAGTIARFMTNGASVTSIDSSGWVAVNYLDAVIYAAASNILMRTTSGLTFSSNTNTALAKLFANGNFSIGTTTDTGAKLNVRGSGTTSATTALRVENSNTSASLVVLDDGTIGIGTSSPSSAYLLDVNGNARFKNTVYLENNVLVSQVSPIQNQNLTITAPWADSTNVTISTITNKPQVLIVQPTANLTLTSGTHDTQRITHTFAPTSGTGVINALTISQSINQTGGANGITRGLYVNPTLTSAVNFRAIETTSGSIIFNHGSTTLMSISSSGNVGINTTASSAYTLDVNGSARVQGAFSTQGPNSSFIESNNALFGLRLEYSGGRFYINSGEAAINGRPFYVGQANAHTSVIMQADSTTKGFLPPRMTNAQRTAISTPAVGLMVYCTDATEGLYINKSTGWTFIA
jgi:hypothetical protein